MKLGPPEESIAAFARTTEVICSICQKEFKLSEIELHWIQEYRELCRPPDPFPRNFVRERDSPIKPGRTITLRPNVTFEAPSRNVTLTQTAELVVSGNMDTRFQEVRMKPKTMNLQRAKLLEIAL
jgi:hypothetical protein